MTAKEFILLIWSSEKEMTCSLARSPMAWGPSLRRPETSLRLLSMVSMAGTRVWERLGAWARSGMVKPGGTTMPYPKSRKVASSRSSMVRGW